MWGMCKHTHTICTIMIMNHNLLSIGNTAFGILPVAFDTLRPLVDYLIPSQLKLSHTAESTSKKVF